MASLLRNLRIYQSGHRLCSLAAGINRNSKAIKYSCSLFTSSKTKDAAVVHEKLHESKVKPVDSTADEQNWISYGYSLVNREEDEWAHHMIMFCTITVLVCWGSFILAYYPDFKDTAWAQREAYLELARREQAGLPLIDGNLIDPSRVELQSDEELGDFEIVI